MQQVVLLSSPVFVLGVRADGQLTLLQGPGSLFFVREVDPVVANQRQNGNSFVALERRQINTYLSYGSSAKLLKTLSNYSENACTYLTPNDFQATPESRVRASARNYIETVPVLEILVRPN